MALEGALVLDKDGTTVNFILTRVDVTIVNNNFKSFAIPLYGEKQDTNEDVNKVLNLKKIIQTYLINGLLNSENDVTALQKYDALTAQKPGGDLTGDIDTNPIIGSPAIKGILMRNGPLKFTWRRNEDGSKKTFVTGLYFKNLKLIDDIKRPTRTTLRTVGPSPESAGTFNENEPEFLEFTVVLVIGVAV